MHTLFLASVFSPTLMPAAVSASVCTVNGQPVDCGPLMAIIIPLWFVLFGLLILMIASMWRIYTKAGEPGWVSVIPVYNAVKLLEIEGLPLWWVILMFVPLVNLVMYVVLQYSLARVFNKGTGFALGLVFLPVIFTPILAFGAATYTNPQPGVARATLA